MKNINWQTLGYVALGIFMLICYAYVDGKEISKKITPDYKLVNDNGYFEILNDDGEMSIFCISKSNLLKLFIKRFKEFSFPKTLLPTCKIMIGFLIFSAFKIFL